MSTALVPVHPMSTAAHHPMMYDLLYELMVAAAFLMFGLYAVKVVDENVTPSLLRAALQLFGTAAAAAA
jgi:hypothetical protein